MTSYKHTQLGYALLVLALVLLIFFAWLYITASAEPASIDSGPNFAIAVAMMVVLFILASFAVLTVSIDWNYLRVKFGYGIFAKKFLLKDIASAHAVKNRWYY